MLKDKQLKQVVKQLKGASKMHAQQAKKVQKHIDAMKKPKMQNKKKYGEYLTKHGLKPYEFEYRDYLNKAKQDSLKNKVDTIHYKDVKGQYYEQIRKAGKKQSERKVETDYAKKKIAERIAKINAEYNKPKMLRNKFKNYC